MKEIWKEVDDFPGYEVSNMGRIKATRIIEGNGRSVQSGGSRQVFLRKNKKGRWFRVHDLVAAAFIGKKPIGSVTLRIDKDGSNNTYKNLFYSSRCVSGLRKRCVGARICPEAKTWVTSVKFNGKTRYLGTFNSQQEAQAARWALVDRMLADATQSRITRCSRA